MSANPAEINELFHQYFDKVLVMTVPRFKERHEKVKDRLTGIDFEFFYGVDKNDLTEAFIDENYHYDKKNSLAVRQYYPPLNKGEIACALSHRKIYQAMLENKWKHVLIFEDDVVPDEQNLHLLEQTLKELPSDWELFYLGYLKNETISRRKQLKRSWYQFMAMLGLSNMPSTMLNNLLPVNYSEHLFKAGFHDCTHAYAISLSGAEKLVKEQSPVIQRADNLLTALVLKSELKAFASKKFLFNQEVFSNHTDQSHIREKWGKV